MPTPSTTAAVPLTIDEMQRQVDHLRSQPHFFGKFTNIAVLEARIAVAKITPAKPQAEESP